MDSITRSLTRNFTFAGTVDELLEVVREWRRHLPGESKPSYFPAYDPRTQEQAVNIDLWTTKYLGSRNERLHIGAVRAKGIYLGDKADVIADRGRDLETLLQNNDPIIESIRRVELSVTLVKYEDVQILRPNWDNRLESYTVRAWKLHHDYFPPIVLHFDPQETTVAGWLQFPEAVQEEGAILLDRISAWERSKPQKIPVRVVISSLDQIPVFPVITLNDFWLKRYADESQLWADSIVNLMAPIEEIRKSIQASMVPIEEIRKAIQASLAPAVAMMDVLSKSVQPFVLEIEEASRVLQGMSFLTTDPMFQSLGHLENFQIAANLSVEIATATRSDEIVISRPVDREGIRAAVREELQTWGGQYENRLVMRVAAEIGIQKWAREIAGADEATMQPPSPDVKGWDAVFNWFYRVPRYYCLTLKTLAKMVSCSESHLLREHAKYKAQYGERPMH